MSGYRYRKLPLKDAILLIERRLGVNDAAIAVELGCQASTVENWRIGESRPAYKYRKPLQNIARRANVEINPETLLPE